MAGHREKVACALRSPKGLAFFVQVSVYPLSKQDRGSMAVEPVRFSGLARPSVKASTVFVAHLPGLSFIKNSTLLSQNWSNKPCYLKNTI